MGLCAACALGPADRLAASSLALKRAVGSGFLKETDGSGTILIMKSIASGDIHRRLMPLLPAGMHILRAIAVDFILFSDSKKRH